jgi:hypothetical protein
VAAAEHLGGAVDATPFVHDGRNTTVPIAADNGTRILNACAIN